jgi:hypothetical protein
VSFYFHASTMGLIKLDEGMTERKEGRVRYGGLWNVLWQDLPFR